MILRSVSSGCTSYGYLCSTPRIPMSSLSFCLLFHSVPGNIKCHDVVVIDGLIIIACSLLAILLLQDSAMIRSEGKCQKQWHSLAILIKNSSLSVTSSVPCAPMPASISSTICEYGLTLFQKNATPIQKWSDCHRVVCEEHLESFLLLLYYMFYFSTFHQQTI